MAGILRHFDLGHGAAEEERFFASYLAHLERNLAAGAWHGRVLPGAADLLDELSRREEITLGLLTGNIAGGAGAKMRHWRLIISRSAPMVAIMPIGIC